VDLALDRSSDEAPLEGDDGDDRKVSLIEFLLEERAQADASLSESESLSIRQSLLSLLDSEDDVRLLHEPRRPLAPRNARTTLDFLLDDSQRRR